MAIREIINAHPKVTMGAVSGVLIVIGVFSAFTTRTPPVSLPTQAYFSDDDGRTFFADRASNVAPFERNGKEILAAHVFQCRGGPLFVGYVERAISAEAKADVERGRAEINAAIFAHPTAGPDGELVTRVRKNLEVKRPGDKTWVNADSAKAVPVLNVTCADGGTPMEMNP